MISYVDASFNDEDDKYKIRPGIAIAAPQVGLNQRIIYINFEDEDGHHNYLLANPVISKASSLMSFLKNGEGCLSVDDEKSGIVPRHFQIEVTAFDLFEEKEVVIECKNLLSICMQHEIDHLDGKLFYDRINPFNKSFKDSN
jgi:peptide deformylase